MKKLFFFLISICLLQTANSQILKKIGEKAKEKIEEKANQGSQNNKSQEQQETDNSKVVQVKNQETTAAEPATMKAFSHYDFVQGEKVVAFDNFERAAIGDFPSSWNTNGSGEVVTLSNKEGKWLKLNASGFYFPEFITNLPENSTLEFDLGVSDNYHWGSSSMHVYLTSLDGKGNFSNWGYYGHSLIFEFHPLTGEGNASGGVYFRTENGSSNISNNANIKNWNNTKNLFAHVSFWRQGQRLRLYVNGDKILDLPRAFDANGKYTDLIFMTHDIQQSEGDYLLLGNVRLATGAPDTRNKLVTEGRFVTSGITFDVNSDKLKPESFGVLKEIATTLTENPAIKVKIIGHTDSDGDATKNIDLSKRRAAAVKTALATEFKIDASRLETDGMGASKPLAENKTSEGKAQNRRVEFVKL